MANKKPKNKKKNQTTGPKPTDHGGDWCVHYHFHAVAVPALFLPIKKGSLKKSPVQGEKGHM